MLQRDAVLLRASFTEHFGGWAEIIVDRRRGERRCNGGGAIANRRARERRRRLSSAEDTVWRVAGYLLVPRPRPPLERAQ